MSRDYMSIGCTPYDEPCLQVGHCSTAHQRAECRVFLNQIERYYPIPDGSALLIKGNAHDFGTYYEVNVAFDPENEVQSKWAYDVEADALNKLQNWDKEALKEIKEYLPSDYFTKVT